MSTMVNRIFIGKLNRYTAQILLIFGISLLALTACTQVISARGNVTPQSSPTPPNTQAPAELREAQISSIEIQISQTEPWQVSAIVRGRLSESCAKLAESQVKYDANVFNITLLVSSPSDGGCMQIDQSFEQIVPLDTSGLAPGSYTVIANGEQATFDLPGMAPQSTDTFHLVVQAFDRSVRLVEVNMSSSAALQPSFNGFLPLGGATNGIAYILDPNNPDAFAIGSNGSQVIEFIQDPAIYGLTVWPGNADTQARLAWGTGPSGLNQSSTIKISTLDGTQFDTLLTQDSPNPPTQLVPEFWSADGQSLYFSKEPLGLGGYILFGGGSDLYKVDINTKEVIQVIPLGPSDGPQACLDAISPDFRYVADHCSQNAIIIRDLVNGTSAIIQPPLGASGYRFVGSAHFSPDGNHLAYALARGEQGNEQGWIALTQINGTSVVILTSPAGSFYTLDGWLDNQTLLVQSTNTQECLPDCATELWALNTDGGSPTKLADGKFLAFISGDLKPVSPVPSAGPGSSCLDTAQYIGDDGKDGTTYAPNSPFTKTWTIKNTGTCTWDSNYLVYQISGAYMTQQPGYWLVEAGRTVEPGQTVDISIGMTAPPEKGAYRSDWILKDEQGLIIPLEGGTSGNSFYVEVNVDDGVLNGGVTSTAIDIVQEQGSGEICTTGSTYFVHAYIITDKATTVSYEIGSTAGQISAGYFDMDGKLEPMVTGALIFDQAGTQSIDLRFVGPYPYPDDISVILRVNGGDLIQTKLDCRN
jgi:hypothetical protein